MKTIFEVRTNVYGREDVLKVDAEYFFVKEGWVLFRKQDHTVYGVNGSFVVDVARDDGESK